MSYSKESISEMAGDLIKSDQLPSNKRYEWIDLVGIPQRPEALKDSLYCASYSDGRGGWDNGFDRRPLAERVAYDKGWDLLIDNTLGVSVPHLKVESVDLFAERVYQRARMENSPFVIGVTGSVGKTTTVAFLEHLINFAGINSVRFYSKRLTPLSVQCHFINRLNKETSVIVMEYSAYMKDHIKELASLLPPDLAFLSNIYDTHINPGMFENKKEIFNSKISIKNQNCKGFLNSSIINDLNLELPVGWNRFQVEDLEINNSSMPPTLRTKELYTIGKIVSKELNIPFTTFLQACESFIPKENRIISCTVDNKNIFFHGETSGGSRLYSWVETVTNEAPWLFVEELNFADEDPQGFRSLLEKIFDSEKTYVLDTKLNRERLICNAKYVNREEFATKLKKAKGYIVYHKALASRQNGFSPEKHLKEILS